MDEKVKQQLLSLLDKFVAVCEQNDLKYYLSGGSVIGAVRHKGFIPWDDDVDVHIPRADYEKLQELPDSVWGEGFRLASWRKTKNYPYDFLKLELTNTTVIERLHPDYIGGVFLDIFPLDGIPDDENQIAQLEKQIRDIEKRYIECTIKNDNECHSIWELIALKMKRACYNHRSHMQRWDNLVTSFGYNQDNLCFSHDYFYFHGPMPSRWFGGGALMDFEGKKYFIPADYDAYLKHVFGNYMQLPPVEKRKGHSFMFVDYDKRITSDEANKIFKQLHKKYAYHISIKREIKYLLQKIGIKR